MGDEMGRQRRHIIIITSRFRITVDFCRSGVAIWFERRPIFFISATWRDGPEGGFARLVCSLARFFLFHLVFTKLCLVHFAKLCKDVNRAFEVLNKVYLQNFLHRWVVNRETNLTSLIRFVSRFTTHLNNKFIDRLHLVLWNSKIFFQKFYP